MLCIKIKHLKITIFWIHKRHQLNLLSTAIIYTNLITNIETQTSDYSCISIRHYIMDLNSYITWNPILQKTVPWKKRIIDTLLLKHYLKCLAQRWQDFKKCTGDLSKCSNASSYVTCPWHTNEEFIFLIFSLRAHEQASFFLKVHELIALWWTKHAIGY